MSEYLLGHRSAEQRRLERQAEHLTADAQWLLDRVGPLAGRRIVEIGCGPRGLLDMLSERVGASGSVVGVDVSAEAVNLARDHAARHDLRNVEVMQGDGRSVPLAGSSVDVVVVRLVLVNVPRPEEIVREAVRLLRPGGMVAFHEADWVAHVTDPPLAAWTRLVKAIEAYAADQGVDLFVGRRLPRLLRAAGLRDVRARAIVGVHEPGSDRRSILADFADNLAERLVDHGVIGSDELREQLTALRRHLDDPDSLVLSHLFVQAWGRRP
jgi:SAM-dependent methyltransferase